MGAVDSAAQPMTMEAFAIHHDELPAVSQSKRVGLSQGTAQIRPDDRLRAYCAGGVATAAGAAVAGNCCMSLAIAASTLA